MALFPEDAVDELLRLYGADELALVRTMIGSSTLRDAARLVIGPQLGPDGEASAAIVIPHYWAVYYHDGRGGFAAPEGRFLVYFADADDDPRLDGGYPVRAQDIVRLTRAQFYDGLARNRERAEAGEGPFMFVVRSVGPAGAHPFFDRLAEGAALRMDLFAEFAIDSFVQENLDEEGPQRATARVRL